MKEETMNKIMIGISAISAAVVALSLLELSKVSDGGTIQKAARQIS